MEKTYDIGEVAEATGLTARALRFYEARGLVETLRTAGGRRIYGPGELSRLNAVVALKRAGFSLTRIAELLEGRRVDLPRVVAIQLAQIDAQAAALADSRALLLSVQSRIDRGEPIDVATICSLIRTGETIMKSTDWKPVVDDYFTPEEQERFRRRWGECRKASIRRRMASRGANSAGGSKRRSRSTPHRSKLKRSSTSGSPY